MQGREKFYADKQHTKRMTMKVMNVTKAENKSLGKIERCKPRAANFQNI
jgi:hypothetical protein